VTNKVYHSRHVVFDESSFPAKDPATSLLPSQLPSTGISAPSCLYNPCSLPVDTTSPILNYVPLPTSQSPSDIPHPPSSPVSALASLPVPAPSSPVPAPASPSALPPPFPDSAPVSLPASALEFLPVPSSPTPTPHSLEFNPNSVTSSASLPSTYPLLPASDPFPAPLLPSSPPSSSSQSLHPMTTRSRTGSLKPSQFPGFKLYRSKYPLLGYHSSLLEAEPSCYRKAASDPR
jgi:hypothetical protein